MTLPTWKSELLRLGGELDSSHEAKVLIEETAGQRVAELYSKLDDPLTPYQRATLRHFEQRRRSGEPLQHIVGHWPFRNLELLVDDRALIPRPETERVVEIALCELERLRDAALACGEDFAPSVVDLGTGTGAIGCAIADEVADAKIIAIDRSSDALALAKENIERLDPRVGARITLLEGNWFSPLRDDYAHCFDLIIANPPYLSRQEWCAVDPVVRDFDPEGALVAGESGLEDLAQIIGEAPHFLREPGVVVCEIGANQGEQVRSLGARSGASSTAIEQDLAGRDRIFVGRFD